MQRLYTTFANGWPGRGLLLLRLALSTFLIAHCFATGLGPDDATWMPTVIALAGLLPAVGLWTPISAGVTALLELWTGFTNGIGRDAHLLAAAIAISLTVLGPGAWSLDARLFGRRRIPLEGAEDRRRV